MNHEELPEYVKGLIYRAIATKLKIGRHQLARSPEAQAKVNRCLVTVKGIAEAKTLNEAVDRLLKMHSEGGDAISPKAIVREVNECYETFNTEIAGVERMHEMNRMQIDSKSKAIWECLRANVPISSDYEDDWLQAADAWILRGEKLNVVLGTATICSFPNPEDESEFVRGLIQAEVAKRKAPQPQNQPLSGMTQQALLENVKSLLRKAIASRLKIARTNYDESLDAQNAVSRCLSNVMSIGYNNSDIDAVLEELCTARHFGEENDKAVIDAMWKEVLATQNTFRSEIAAFAKMHEMNQAGAAPVATWAQVQSMVVLGEDYTTNIQP
jgi:hypothetical protein